MFDLIRHKTASHRADLLSGLTVALALVPEAVAFAFGSTRFTPSIGAMRWMTAPDVRAAFQPAVA